MRDEAALQLGAASFSTGGCREPSSPEPKPEQSGLVSKTCCLPKFQARILGKTFWDLYKYFSAAGEPLVLALALLQAVEESKSKSLLWLCSVTRKKEGLHGLLCKDEQSPESTSKL